MRTLSDTLLAAQKVADKDALYKIVLTHGENEYTYDKSRILDIDPEEEPYSQKAKLLLSNSDGTLTDLDLKGYQGVISFGAVTGEGDEYSANAPLWVIDQQLNSSPSGLYCELSLIGIMNLLAEDRASEPYNPDEDDEDTVKDLINAILGATLDCFSHCKAWEVVWDSEDDLIDSFQPKDGFKILTNWCRLAVLRKLLDFTKCVARPEADGKIHIFNPTISGEVYDYEYERAVEGKHPFWSKAYRKSLVIPNYIIVKSRKNDTDKYEGEAKDQDSIDALATNGYNGEIRQYKLARLQSDDEAKDIAEATIGKYQLHANMGGAEVPMNVGAEIFDYVKVTDDRESDYRVGNVGHISRHIKRGRRSGHWTMNFSFGGWLSVRGLASDLNVYPDGILPYYEELFVENLYTTYIYAQMIDVDFLSAFTAHMGQLTAGEIKIGTGTLEPAGTATGGSNITLEDTGASWDVDEWSGEDIVVVIDRVKYTRAVSSNTETIITLAALPDGVEVAVGTEYFIGKITVASGDSYFVKGSGSGTATGGSTTTLEDSSKDWETDEHKGKQLSIIKNGYWYQRKVTSNEATTLHFDELPSYEPFTGFRLWADSELGRIAGFKEGVMQFYTGSDGVLYAGGGKVLLDKEGVSVKDNRLFRAFDEDTEIGYLYVGNAGWGIIANSGKNIVIGLNADTPGDIIFNTPDGAVVKGISDGYTNLGSIGTQFKGGYFKSRLKIPVGTDMYD